MLDTIATIAKLPSAMCLSPAPLPVGTSLVCLLGAVEVVLDREEFPVDIGLLVVLRGIVVLRIVVLISVSEFIDNEVEGNSGWVDMSVMARLV